MSGLEAKQSYSELINVGNKSVWLMGEVQGFSVCFASEILLKVAWKGRKGRVSGPARFLCNALSSWCSKDESSQRCSEGAGDG